MHNPIFAIAVDLALFAINIYLAVTQRGTWIGWLCALLVCWQVYVFVKGIKEVF